MRGLHPSARNTKFSYDVAIGFDENLIPEPSQGSLRAAMRGGETSTPDKFASRNRKSGSWYGPLPSWRTLQDRIYFEQHRASHRARGVAMRVSLLVPQTR